MSEQAMAEALDSLVELARRNGEGRIPLGEAISVAGALGIRTRLLCGADREMVERFIVLATSDPVPLVAIRRSGERHGKLLERREQVDGDEWEYAFEEETLGLALWLELHDGAASRVERVQLAPYVCALLDEHGWRDDLAGFLAEPRAWMATFLVGVARVLGIFDVEADSVDLSTPQSRIDAARHAAELLRQSAVMIAERKPI